MSTEASSLEARRRAEPGGMTLVPLSYATLSGASRILAACFPGKWWTRLHLVASLNPWRTIGLPRLGGCGYLRYWIAANGAEIVGLTGLYWPRHSFEGVAWLGWTGVAPAARRRGIARQMIESMANAARESGMRTLATYTSERFPAAIEMYRALGFEAEPARGRWTIFRKKIAPAS